MFKVMRQPVRPVVVCSTGHFSMGGEIECLEMMGDKLHYIIENLFDKTVEYSVLLPDGRLVQLCINRGKQEGIV